MKKQILILVSILACGSSLLSQSNSLSQVDTLTWYRDSDADGYGNVLDSVFATELPTGYVANGADCNDQNAAINPGASEICGNGVDDNCDGISEIDTIPPLAKCIASLKLYLDSAGIVSINASQLNDGSSDNCSSNLSFSANKTLFECSDTLLYYVTLTVSDPSGNSSTCEAIVKVQDPVSPIAICRAPFDLPLDDYGNAALNVDDINDGSYDNCSITLMSVNRTTFNCADLGLNPVTLRVDDPYGNYSYCETQVNVVDKDGPTVVCVEFSTIALNSSGIATLQADDLNIISYDACSANLSYSIDTSLFNCEDLGVHTVTLSVSDEYGNINTCQSEVSVVDKTNPTVFCAEGINVQVDSFGIITLDPLALNGGCYDNCNVMTFQISPQQFSILDTGIVSVTLTVADHSGNDTTCVTNVVVTAEKTSAVHNLPDGLNMTVSPNPSTGLFELIMDAGQLCDRVQVFKASGQLIMERSLSTSRFNFDLSDQESGCYYLRVQSGIQVKILKLMVLR